MVEHPNRYFPPPLFLRPLSLTFFGKGGCCPFRAFFPFLCSRSLQEEFCLRTSDTGVVHSTTKRPPFFQPSFHILLSIRGFPQTEMLSSKFVVVSFLYIFYATGLAAAGSNQLGGGNQLCQVRPRASPLDDVFAHSCLIDRVSRP